jgi:1,4-alpha-glucan branching enzyme
MTPHKSARRQPSANNTPLSESVDYSVSLLSDTDLYLFNEGNHHRLYDKLGAYPLSINDTVGTYFAAWALNARDVLIICDFNGWDRTGHRLVVACSFTPETHFNYDIGVLLPGTWEEILNSDVGEYGGSGQGNFGPLSTSNKLWHGHSCSLTLTIPPLAVIYLKKRLEAPS